MAVRPHPAARRPSRRQGPDRRFRSGQVVFERLRSRLAAGVPGTGEEIRAGEVAAVGDIGPVRACVDAHRRPAVAGARGNPDRRGGQFLALHAAPPAAYRAMVLATSWWLIGKPRARIT